MTMRTTPEKAIAAYDETVQAVEKAIVFQTERARENSPFQGRVAREQLPFLAAMKAFLEGADPQATGAELVRVSQSLQRYENGTYTSFLSSPKYMRQAYYLKGLAAMVIVGGESLGWEPPARPA